MKRLGLTRGEEILVAFSGGPDSTALLAALAACGRFRVAALHVNHGLRGKEADRDEAMAASTAMKLGVRYSSAPATVTRRAGESIEEAARRTREEAFAAAGVAVVATGHTLDDQAETVLYRAARGAGPRGLRGILPSRHLAPGVRLLRPLLGRRRAEVLAYLRRRGLEFATDSTNADPRFARNRIRRDVLPSLEMSRPGAARHLAALARESADLDAWITREAEAAFRRLNLPEGLDAAGLAALPAALRHAVVALAAPGAGPLRAAHRASLDRLFVSPPRRLALLGRGWFANLRSGVLRLVPPARAADADTVLPVPGECELASSGKRLSARVEAAGTGFLDRFLAMKTRGEEALDASAVRGPLVAGPPRRGERMHPLGAPGSRKIADILTDLGVPRSRRAEELVVRDARGAVVWLVGRRVAEHARVTGKTRRVLLVSAR
ncbi:MAG: tRNA lysidine(34) synthetase TilS [Planctomycetota bacterium]